MSAITNTKLQVDKLDYMNETELRVALRRVLNIVDQIYNGSSDDCEYNYDWLHYMCNEALEFECAVAPCFGNKTSRHVHEINEWKEYCHPVIKVKS